MWLGMKCPCVLAIQEVDTGKESGFEALDLRALNKDAFPTVWEEVAWVERWDMAVTEVKMVLNVVCCS